MDSNPTVVRVVFDIHWGEAAAVLASCLILLWVWRRIDSNLEAWNPLQQGWISPDGSEIWFTRAQARELLRSAKVKPPSPESTTRGPSG